MSAFSVFEGIVLAGDLVRLAGDLVRLVGDLVRWTFWILIWKAWQLLEKIGNMDKFREIKKVGVYIW